MSRDWYGRLGVFLTDMRATVTPRLHAPSGRTPPLEIVADAQGNLLTSDDHPSTHVLYPCGTKYAAMPARRWRHQRLTPWLEELLPALGLDGRQQAFLLAYARQLPAAPYYDATILTPSQRRRMVGRIDITPQDGRVTLFETVFLFQPAYERLDVQPPPYTVREPTRGPSATLVGGFYRKDEELTLPIPHLVQHAPFRQHVVMARSPDGRPGR